MSSILENVGKLAAAISLALVAVSVIYEWGYFHVIGSEFQRFASPADYLSNAIGWLPYLVLSLFGLAFFAGIQISFQFMQYRWGKVTTDHDPFNLSLVTVGTAAISVFALPRLQAATHWPVL